MIQTSGKSLIAALPLLLIAASAQSDVESFYKGKTFTVTVGAGAGGGFDTYARLLARHMGKHIPGHPTLIVQNIPGGSGLAAARQLVTTAPRDGTIISALNRVTGTEPLMRPELDVDPTRLVWVGSLNRETIVVIAWHNTPFQTFEDVFNQEFLVSAAAAGTDGVVYPTMMNALLGTKYKVISGYDAGEMSLAVERGEVHGRSGVPWTTIKANHGDWIQENKIKILLQIGRSPHPELAGVPSILGYLKDKDTKTKQMFEVLFARQEAGRPFATTPDVPSDRLAALRKAFMDSTTDPNFIAEAEKGRMDVEPVSGEDLQGMMEEVYRIPREVFTEIGKIIYP